MSDDCIRNYKVVALSPTNTVVIEIAGERRDTGEKPSAWGTYGLSRYEIGILRKGLTATGRDRR